jgi:hypothetical protein
MLPGTSSTLSVYAIFLASSKEISYAFVFIAAGSEAFASGAAAHIFGRSSERCPADFNARTRGPLGSSFFRTHACGSGAAIHARGRSTTDDSLAGLFQAPSGFS